MTSQTLDSRTIRPAVFWGIALTLIFVWGTAYTLVSVAVRDVSPIWLVSARTALAAILLVSYAKFRGRTFPPLTDARWLWYGGMGLTGIVLPFFFFAIAQKTVDSGICAIIGSAMPLMTIVLAHFFVNETLTWRKFLGFITGFAGVVVLFLPNDFSLELVSDWRAQLIALLAAALYAVTTIAAKRAPDTAPSVAAAMMVTSGAVVSGIAALTSGIPAEIPPPIAIWAMIGLGIGSTGFATILYLNIIQKTGPSTLARINYFPAIVSVAAGVWFLQEPFTWRIVIAFVVIVIGMVISRSGNKPLAVKPL